MEYKKIVIIGGGVLGSQIAFQCAYSGYETTLLIRPDDNKQKIKKTLAVFEKIVYNIYLIHNV